MYTDRQRFFEAFAWFLLTAICVGFFLAFLCTPGCASGPGFVTALDGLITVAPLPTDNITPEQALESIEIAGTSGTDWAALAAALAGGGGITGAALIALRILQNRLRSRQTGAILGPEPAGPPIELGPARQRPDFHLDDR